MVLDDVNLVGSWDDSRSEKEVVNFVARVLLSFFAIILYVKIEFFVVFLLLGCSLLVFRFAV